MRAINVLLISCLWLFVGFWMQEHKVITSGPYWALYGYTFGAFITLCCFNWGSSK